MLCWGRRSTPWGLVAVLLPATVFLTLSALALPSLSNDIVDYVLSGRVAATYGASPYEVAPDTFPDDPLRPYATGDYTTDPESKPPVWIAAAIIGAAVGGDDPAAAVLTFRLGFLVMSLANLALVAAVLRRWRPDHLLAGLVLYGWNPIVVMHGQSKFDTLMASFALLAALFVISSRRYAAVAALWASVLVKVLPLPLLAAYFLSEIRARQWRRVVISGLILSLMTGLAYAPFDGWITLLPEHLAPTGRIGSFLPGGLNGLVTAAAAGLVLWVGLTARADPERLLQGWALLSLALILLSPISWSWYLITPLAIVSLSGSQWKSLAVFFLSGLAFLFDTWNRGSSEAFPLPEPESVSRSAIYVVLVTVAALVVLAVIVASRRRANSWN
jgi:hypothetical protein